ncbi:nucleic acid-binding protein [Panus rudis PR-1116 ss-1]|nr:nucleic acid-binding protein [Panus rudis PR-1116 ss-1]
MSAPAALTKLQSPLKELVTESSKDIPSAFGRTEKDQAEVSKWIEDVASGVVPKPDGLKDLDAQLVPRTYIVNNYLTAADVALYGALHPTFSQLQPAQYYSHPALTRYFDHIQTRPPVRKVADSLAPAFSSVTLDLENTPHLERKAEAPKKKEKAAKPGKDSAAVESSAPADKGESKKEAAASTSSPQQQAQKKEKKEKKEKKPAAEAGTAKKDAGGKKGGAAAADEGSGEPVPSMIDLRVGRIVDVKVHPDADGLYVEQIDFGEETGPRTVISGLVKYVPIEQMRDRWLVGVCNLKPANMRGIKSFAMVLCATHKDGKDAGIEIVQPPEGSKVGDRVYFEGPEYENATPLPQLNPKKKIFETIQPGFTTLETREAAWVNPVTKSVHKIRTTQGVCVAPTFVGASLS